MKEFRYTLMALALALSMAASGVEDFTGAAAGSFPGRWGATDKNPPAGVIDSGDPEHGNVMCVPGRQGKALAYTRMFLEKAAQNGVVSLEFDFFIRGEADVYEFGILAPGVSLKELMNTTPVLLRLDGRHSALFYRHADGKLKSLGKFSAGQWHRLALEIAFSGPDKGSWTISLDGRQLGGGRLGFKCEGNAMASIWFISRPVEGGGNGMMLIDNVKVEHREAAEAETPALDDRIVELSFFSRALNREKRYMAMLPPGVAVGSDKTQPILLFLHGRGRNERSLIDDPEGRAALADFRGVVVLPSGDDGWYINSPMIAADRYNDYIEELLADAAARLPVTTERSGRGITGWSMGGYGCAMFAEAHAGEFAAFAPIIGLLDFPRDGLPEGQSYEVPEKRFGTDREVWARFNPINGAGALRDMKILIITGTAAFDRTMNRNFKAELEKLNIPCQYRELGGGHSFNVVTAATRLVVEFMNESLQSGK